MIETFIQENIKSEIDCFESVGDLYARFLLFCKFHNTQHLTRVKFHNQLKRFNVGVTDERRRKNRANTTYRWGVKLLPCKY